MASQLIFLFALSIVAIPQDSHQSCGVPAFPHSRVIGGQRARDGAWPWQVALFRNYRFSCGGSLISPNWVVTAAHCVAIRNPRSYMVVLGTNDLSKVSSTWQLRRVSQVIAHPSYRRLNYDIALLRLSKPATLGPKVRPVCLPKETDVVPVGTKCYITGWGKIKHPGGAYPFLQQADLPVISKQTCAALNSKLVPVPISDQMLCAGHGPGNAKSGCHGDSGGPFVCQHGNGKAFTLHGAVSWGSSTCNTRLAYTVFARITSLRSWIGKYTNL